ncbi:MULTISPECIES: hypothetical protein [Eubacteriales]|uniref:hypothetical protein n=1 Tax=Eubacteriales TaxID=186802 RepID=UPI00130238D9|nr:MULTISPECIES: hypothetical protein [Eubacteriales]MDY4166067.1 hypothetical protein [Fournierella sp.]
MVSIIIVNPPAARRKTRAGKVKVSGNDFTTPVNKRKESANKPKAIAASKHILSPE